MSWLINTIFQLSACVSSRKTPWRKLKRRWGLSERLIDEVYPETLLFSQLPSNRAQLLLAAIAALQMALWIALSAFGAHALKASLTPASIALWDTASLYLGIGSLAVLSLSLLLPTLTRPLWLLEIGVLLFSFSLYALALGAPTIVGVITPLGGLSMVIAFLWLAYELYQLNTRHS